MNLGFKERFKQPIFDGTKIHSIREDKYDRWQAGRKIHGATGTRTKNYDCFFEDVCKSTQDIEIVYDDEPFVYIDGKILWVEEIELLAKHDGFNSMEDFFKWFDKDFKGKIIHWTDFRY